MEVQQWPLLKQEILAQPNGAILSLKVFDEGQLMAAFDASGEVHTYSRSKNKWIHRSCAKLFEGPIVASDIIFRIGTWHLLVVDFGGTLKVCKITLELEMITTHELKTGLGSPIINSLFYDKPDTIVATTETGFLVFINLISKEKELVQISLSSGVALVRLGSQQGKIYLSSGKKVLLYNYQTQQKSQIVELDQDIVDFAISKQNMYPILAVLTQQQLLFYILSQGSPIRTTVVELNSQHFCSKLGWGKNYREIGLYQCINGFVQTRRFYKANTGKWFQEAGTIQQGQKVMG